MNNRGVVILAAIVAGVAAFWILLAFILVAKGF